MDSNDTYPECMGQFKPDPIEADKVWKPTTPCRHPGHNPPGMMVIREPYTHVCPACGGQAHMRPSVVFM